MNTTYTMKPMKLATQTPDQIEVGNYIKREKHWLKHGCKHEAWVQQTISYRGEAVAHIDPVVRLANNDDGYYTQTFHNRAELGEFIAELGEFIAELNAAADQAWGKKLRAAAKQALEAWDETVLPKHRDGMMQERMEMLRAALAEPTCKQPLQVEPVATVTVNDAMGANFHFTRPHTLLPGQVLYVYTAPQTRRLTDEEIDRLVLDRMNLDRGTYAYMLSFKVARAIEAAIW